MDTGSRKWGSPYLNRDFFALLGERMGDQCVLFVADEDGHPVASALNLIGSHALYGRYWGRLADVPFLHFELCYYQAIDLAIELGLSRVEAGAQGEHKLARGYIPAPTYSAHWIAHPGLRAAVSNYLNAETPALIDEAEMLTQHTPFKKSD
jgi:predicted N-acyltransferase